MAGATIDSLQIEVKANSSSASRSLDKLIKRLEALENAANPATASFEDMSRALSSFSGALNSAAAGNSTRNLDNTSGAMNNVGRIAKRTKSSFKGLASYIGKFYATYFAAVRGIKGLWRGVQSAMDYTETFNYFNVTMDKIAKQYKDAYSEFGYASAEEYADSFSKRLVELNKKLTGYKIGDKGELTTTGMVGLGMNVEQMMNFQAKIGAVTNSVGQLGEVSLQTQKALSMLAVDFASLTNTDLDTVMNNLTSGIIGQSRALYKYGVDITNATLAQVALAHGVTQSVAEMTQAQKQQLRLLAILEQSKIAWADAANTINSVANQYRVFQAQISNLGRTIGSVFLPIVKNLLPYLNGLAIALNRVFETLGFRLWGNSWLTELQDGISGGVADGLEEMGDEAEDTTESIKKLKDNLQGFDEINKLQGDDEGLGLSGDLGLTTDIIDAVSEYEKVWEEAYKKSANKAGEIATVIYEKITNINWSSVGKQMSKWANNLIEFMTKSLRKTNWTAVGKAIGDMIAGIDIGKTIGNLTKLAVGIVGGIGTALTGAVVSAPIESALIAGILVMKTSGLGAAIAGKLGTALSGLGVNFGLAGMIASVLAVGVSAAIYTVASKDVRAWENEVKAYESTITNATRAKISEFNTLATNSISKFSEAIDGLNNTVNTSINSITNAGANYTSLQPIINEWLELYGKANLTAEEVARMQTLEDTIVSQSPEYQKVLDQKNLSYNDMADALARTTEELIKQATAEAARQQIFSLSQAYTEAKDKLEEFENENLESMKNFQKTRNEWKKAQTTANQLTASLDDDLDKLAWRYYNFEISEEEYIAEKKRLIETEKEARETANNLGEQVKKEAANYNKLRATYLELGGAVDNAANKLEWATQVASGQISATESLKEKTSATTDAIKGMIREMDDGETEIKSYSDLLGKVPGNVTTTVGVENLTETESKLDEFYNRYVNKPNAIKFTSAVDTTGATNDFNAWKAQIEQAKITFQMSGDVSGIKQVLEGIGINGIKTEVGGKQIIDFSGLNEFYRKIKGFAGGAYNVPEDGWFRASHGEFFGQFDNGTSYIANNAQITAGIEAGVYNAMVAAGAGGASSPIINVYVGGSQLTDVVIEDMNRRTIANGVSPILI